jgi:hypothetical protein
MAAAASFNGGRSQTGLNFLQTGGEYPFLNVVKTSANWAYSSAPNKDGVLDPALLDENGYPTSIQTGGYYSVCFVPSSWVGLSLTVQWDGGGTIRVPGTGTVGSTTSSNGSTDNFITCTCIGQSLIVGAVATSASPNHVKNIRVSLTGTETTLLTAGEVFRPEFKNKLLEAGFGVLRFMDWQVNNTTNMTDWTSRKPTTYFSYQATEFRNTASTGRPKLVCGVTSGSGNTYTITGNGDGVPASGAPANMQIIQLNFHADATESGGATLNLNGSGAKSILAWWGDALSPGANSYPKAFYSGTSIPIYGTLIFDSGLDGWLLLGGSYAYNTMGLHAGVPAELCLQLAAEIGAHAWFVSPRLALDAPTDYIPSLAAYCRDNAPSWMIPRFETPNEVFNTASAAFHNGVYGRNKANVRWGSSDSTKSHGYWGSILGQAVAAAYNVAQANTKTQTRYHLISGVQTFAGSAATYDQNMSSAAYVGQAAAAPAGYSKAVGTAEAWRWTTHIATAQYFSPSDYTSPEETAAVAAYQTANATTKTALLYNYVMSCVRTNVGGSSFNIAAATTQYAMWKTWAQSFSVNKMCGYEGGFSPDYDASSNANNFRNDCKGVDELAGMLAAVFQAFIGQSDSTFTAEFPSTFLLTDFTGDGSTTTYCWTLLKGEINSANTPQFDFITRFNKGRRAINLRLKIHG